MLQDVDVSWPQRSYHPGAESGVIIAATSGDTASGSLFTQSTFVEDVANARAAGKEVAFYHFNGGTDPVGSARYFWSVIEPYFRPGDIVILDVESWQGGTRPAWTPAQATVFANELARLRALTTQQSRLGIYGNRSDMRASGWGALERAGSWLFLASPGGYPENTPVGEWSHWTILQYSSAGGVDRDESELTFAQIANSQGDDLMATPEERQALINELLNYAAFDGGPTVSVVLREAHNVYAGLYVGGPSVPGGGSIVNLIDAVPARVPTAPVDVAAVAQAVIAQLPPQSLTTDNVRAAVAEVISKTTLAATS